MSKISELKITVVDGQLNFPKIHTEYIKKIINDHDGLVEKLDAVREWISWHIPSKKYKKDLAVLKLFKKDWIKLHKIIGEQND
jgi:hypothetical protein